jgi:hypothetical protein
VHETAVRPYDTPVPVRVRTARKAHHCDDCRAPIERGDRYEVSVIPPHRSDAMDTPRWLTWRNHAPRFGPSGEFLYGCAMAAAYREKTEREATADGK